MHSTADVVPSAHDQGGLPDLKVDVPDPIPLDPARDLPLSALGSTWIVAAGPSQPGASDFKGKHCSPCCVHRRVLAWVRSQQHRQEIGSPEVIEYGSTASGRELSAGDSGELAASERQDDGIPRQIPVSMLSMLRAYAWLQGISGRL